MECLNFFYIFWWWLLHCSAYLVPINVAIVLNILSILLRYLLRKWLLWISKNQWYLLFYSKDQCPKCWLALFYSTFLIFFILLGDSMIIFLFFDGFIVGWEFSISGLLNSNKEYFSSSKWSKLSKRFIYED